MTSGDATSSRDEREPPVLVFGRGITALGVLRTLGRRGVRAYLVSESPGILRRSRWYRTPPGADPGGRPTPATLARWLEDGCRLEMAVLIACSDTWARSVVALPDRLADSYPASVPDAEVLATFLDKLRLGRRLRELDVPHPRTVEIQGVAELEALDEELLSTGFLKPRDTDEFLSQFGVKAFPFEGLDEAVERYRELEAAGLGAVVQEYIPGPATSHVFLDGFMDRESRVRGLLARRRVRMFPGDFGNSTVTETLPLADVAPANASLRHLLSELGYRGVFSAEFKRDARDGRFKLLEVNGRPWWYVEFAARCGVDVCHMAYRDALGRPVPEATDYRIGARCVHGSGDLEAFRQARRSGGVGVGSWFRPWLGASQTVFSVTDPGPGLTLAARLFGRTLCQGARRVRDRLRAGGRER